MSNTELILFQVFWIFFHISYKLFVTAASGINFPFCVMTGDLSTMGFIFPSEDEWAEFQSLSLLVSPSRKAPPLNYTDKPLSFTLRHTYIAAQVFSL